VTYLYCPRCNQPEKVYRPHRQIVPDQVPCPACQTERIFDVASSITAGDATRELPLAQLGIPALDIVEIRGGQAQVYLELSGDEPHVLAGW
jgi:hypothetical protein